MLLPKPTSAEVSRFRDQHECSLFEAFSHLRAEWRNNCLVDIRRRAGEISTIEQCRDVIADMLDMSKEFAQ